MIGTYEPCCTAPKPPKVWLPNSQVGRCVDQPTAWQLLQVSFCLCHKRGISREGSVTLQVCCVSPECLCASGNQCALQKPKVEHSCDATHADQDHSAQAVTLQTLAGCHSICWDRVVGDTVCAFLRCNRRIVAYSSLPYQAHTRNSMQLFMFINQKNQIWLVVPRYQ